MASSATVGPWYVRCDGQWVTSAGVACTGDVSRWRSWRKKERHAFSTLKAARIEARAWKDSANVVAIMRPVHPKRQRPAGPAPRHAIDEVGECTSWCEACRTNVSAGLNPDGTAKVRTGTLLSPLLTEGDAATCPPPVVEPFLHGCDPDAVAAAVSRACRARLPMAEVERWAAVPPTERDWVLAEFSSDLLWRSDTEPHKPAVRAALALLRTAAGASGESGR